MNKKGINSHDIPPIDLHDQTYYTDKEKAEVFVDFFIQQSTLDNDDDPLPDIDFSPTELNEITI